MHVRQYIFPTNHRNPVYSVAYIGLSRWFDVNAVTTQHRYENSLQFALLYKLSLQNGCRDKADTPLHSVGSPLVSSTEMVGQSTHPALVVNDC